MQRLAEYNNYAERNGEFIVQFMKGRGSKEFQVVVSGKNMLEDSTKKPGLYMFFVSPKDSQGYCLYPIYVGYTSRTFDERFKEHASKKKGVFEKFFINGQPETCFQGVKKKCDLYVMELPMDPRVAKLLESVFLEAFDFALNTEENGKERKSVELSTAVGALLSKELFTKVWKTVKEDIDKYLS